MTILARLGVIRQLFCIRAFDRCLLINHADGLFYDRDTLESIDEVYPQIRTVYNSSHTMIAKRKRPQDELYWIRH